MNAARTNPPDLDAIRTRADKATPGPWYPVVNDLVGGWSCSTVNAPASHGPSPTPADFLSLEDARFVAHAREDIPALLTEIERLREALTEVAEHPVVSPPAAADDLCDWHCTLTLVARAKDALAAQESAE